MANTFLNSDLLSKKAAQYFKLDETFVGTANHTYERMFTDATYKSGLTVNLTMSNIAEISRGDVIAASDIQERSMPLTLGPLYSSAATYTTTDFQTKIGRDRWAERVLHPAVQRIAAELNADIARAARTQINKYVGVPGTPLSSFPSVNIAGVKLLQHAVPRSGDWYFAASLMDSHSLKASLSNSFNDTLNENINMKSSLGHLSYFDMFEDQAIAIHDNYTGALGTPVMKATVSSGGTITLSGMTASITGIITDGSLITIDNTFSVNPINKQSTGGLMSFVVLGDANSDVSGDCVVNIFPNVITTGNNSNVNTALGIGETVTVIGGSTPSNTNVAYTDMGLYVVCPPMAKLDSPDSSTYVDPDTGLSLRVSKTAEVLNNANVIRVDLLAGFLWIPECAVRVLS